MTAIEVVGVYHANGGVLGEIAYVFGKILGQTECALCDVTHRLVLEKRVIKSWRCSLPYSLSFKHLNELSVEMAEFVSQRSPCVVLKRNSQLSVLIDRDTLVTMNGDEDAFVQCVELRMRTLI